jgi:hypothetical protein
MPFSLPSSKSDVKVITSRGLSFPIFSLYVYFIRQIRLLFLYRIKSKATDPRLVDSLDRGISPSRGADITAMRQAESRPATAMFKRSAVVHSLGLATIVLGMR